MRQGNSLALRRSCEPQLEVVRLLVRNPQKARQFAGLSSLLSTCGYGILGPSPPENVPRTEHPRWRISQGLYHNQIFP